METQTEFAVEGRSVGWESVSRSYRGPVVLRMLNDELTTPMALVDVFSAMGWRDVRER
jgi:hypothetical protein